MNGWAENRTYPLVQTPIKDLMSPQDLADNGLLLILLAARRNVHDRSRDEITEEGGDALGTTFAKVTSSKVDQLFRVQGVSLIVVVDRFFPPKPGSKETDLRDVDNNLPSRDELVEGV